MTEAEWLACDHAQRMLTFLRGGDRNRLPERKSRLFGVACCRRFWSLMEDPRSRDALTIVERYADGAATSTELDRAYDSAFDVEIKYAEHPDRAGSAILEALGRVANAVAAACHPDELAEGVTCELLTASDAAEMSGEEAALATLVRDIFGNPFRPVVADPAWLTDTAVSLARGMYESRDFSAMPILAEALQDAGCDNTDMLNHCRDASETHVRGCWVVDLVLGRS